LAHGTPAWQPSSDMPLRVWKRLQPEVPLLCSSQERESTPPHRMSRLQTAFAAVSESYILPLSEA